MSRIKQLPPHEAHKIAAGEVVERPANVVKELIENALDAGATQISVYIEHAGKKLIRVVDNGSGMDAEDAHRCFDHHATSKISTIHDLTSLSTFGFRGEALSSIAAVSLVTLITKEASSPEGIKLELEHGRVVHETITNCAQGTDISIKDLFSNVPARLKFLRTDDTEWRQIVLLFQAFCLDYHTIQFTLTHNGSVVHHCPQASNLMERLTQLWNHTFTNNIIPLVPHTQHSISISGALSHHHFARYDRSSIFFFVNRRWVKNQHLVRSLVKGYMNVLPQGRFPAAFIFIDIDPSQVDINVHPRKEEVQFLHPRKCEVLVHDAVKKSLEQHVSHKVSYQEKNEKLITPQFNFDAPVFAQPDVEKPEFFKEPIFIPHHIPQQSVSHVSISEPQHSINETITQESLGTIVGHFNKTYILLEQADGLYIVDQHAAHERILYEQFNSHFQTVEPIACLFPEIISLSRTDIALLEPYLDSLNKIGLVIELFGENELIIQASPIVSKHISFKELTNEIISFIQEHKELEHHLIHTKLNEKVHAQMACKSAIKAGDDLTHQQMEQLLKDRQKTNNRFTCPHGRPTGWLLPLYEIEKKFKRKR